METLDYQVKNKPKKFIYYAAFLFILVITGIFAAVKLFDKPLLHKIIPEKTSGLNLSADSDTRSAAPVKSGIAPELKPIG